MFYQDRFDPENMYGATERGRCKKYSDQTDQTGQMTKDIFGDSQVGSLAWELVYF